jgi:hypothetical protein
VLASAGLGFDFNLATKHWAVHHLHVERGLPPRVIAEQVGWELAGTLKVLKVYATATSARSRKSTGRSGRTRRRCGRWKVGSGNRHRIRERRIRASPFDSLVEGAQRELT